MKVKDAIVALQAQDPESELVQVVDWSTYEREPVERFGTFQHGDKTDVVVE